MQISWTKLPFRARSKDEFGQKLTEWLSWVFYEELPEKGYEVREEQIYTAFRMARALVDGDTLMAEAGPGTGKTFAYLLPAVCYARLKGAPVVVASASGVLQSQLANPEGDIQTLSRLLGLNIDARVAADPGEYICEVKVQRTEPLEPPEGWDELKGWAQLTGSGARMEMPHVGDDLWEMLAWDPSLPCDTCPKRGHCHVMSARRHYRESADLIVCDHKLFSRDLLTRAERHEAGEVPLLPAYAAAVLDEGHHVPETWQRVQGYSMSRNRLNGTLKHIGGLTERGAPVRAQRESMRLGREFYQAVADSAEPGEGKRGVPRSQTLLALAHDLDKALERLQDELVTDEAMHEGYDLELEFRAYSLRLDDVRAGLRMLRSEDSVCWYEGDQFWVVPRRPLGLFAKERLSQGTPVVFSSATLEPKYQARVLRLEQYQASKVGVPFDLGEQVLVYRPGAAGDEIEQVVSVIRASGGRALVLLHSLAEVRRYKQALAGVKLPFTVIWEGEGDRGAQLEQFREDVTSVLFGATFWEGVDVPGEALSCVVIPRLPFPEHDPLIRERRAQA
ncbi:MAG TPA: ATP-dependent DNA helicase, partial [Symbiobacteriaceae bacterium]|nr:ATP-dependent DNA helicase [Symbiobacteriaceae bacterium]